MYVCMVFTTEGMFEIAIERWPKWNLNPVLNIIYIYMYIYIYIYVYVFYYFVSLFFVLLYILYIMYIIYMQSWK